MRKFLGICIIVLFTLSIPLSSISANLKQTNNHTLMSNDYYIKNPKTPKKLYVISESDMTKEERTMISALQGIISTKSYEQIYITGSKNHDYEVWLNDLNKNYYVKYENIKDPFELLNKFKSYVKGYILYNASNKPSINNACTLSGLKDGIAIDETLESKVNGYGIKNLIKDCRNTDKFWAYDNLWKAGLNHTTVVELSPDKSTALRDYAIMSKSLIFYEDDLKDTALREKVLGSMDDTARCLGWGPDEYSNVKLASKFGVDIVAADWSNNLSTLSGFPSTPKTQKPIKELSAENGNHYVTFIMSDGDNQQWFLGNNFTSKKWYGSPNRGNFNLGWSISPSLYYLAPTVFNMYYESASHEKSSDSFIVPPSGNGYIYPSLFPSGKIIDYTKRLSEYMKKVDQKNVLILDDNSFKNKDLWNKFTKNSNIDGLFYMSYKRANDYNGEIIWSNNKPVVSCRSLLWAGLEDENDLVKSINERVKLGYTDPKNSNSYTFVYVHVWSKSLDDVQNVVNRLNANPKIKIVTPDNFISLIKSNITPN